MVQLLGGPGLLEVLAADLVARHVRGGGEHGHPTAVRIVEPVDQVHVAGGRSCPRTLQARPGLLGVLGDGPQLRCRGMPTARITTAAEDENYLADAIHGVMPVYGQDL